MKTVPAYAGSTQSTISFVFRLCDGVDLTALPRTVGVAAWSFFAGNRAESGTHRISSRVKVEPNFEAEEFSVEHLIRCAEDRGLGAHLAQARTDLAAFIETEVGVPSLKTLRLRANLTQRQLAQRVGTSQPRIAFLEGKKQKMSLEFAQKLADALGVSVNDLPRTEVP